LPPYYSAADALVVPSYYESFGLVGLESLACGTPVAATRVGAMEDIIEDGKTGHVVADLTPCHSCFCS
jgi:D-inositol-3-phosphate glycosyltransferase